MLCINGLRQCLFFLALINLCGSFLRTAPPLKPNFPFAFMWNAPSELCERKFGVSLDLNYTQLVSSTLKTAVDQRITLFYTDRFGIFPWLNEKTGEKHDEGLPQYIDFDKHLELAEDDIVNYIPFDRPGLAVLDFEEWRPQWVRNWGGKAIYREQSVEMLMKNDTSLTHDEAKVMAKKIFESAAKKYFLESLNLGKKLRPARLWGYYLYPDCYNYDYNKDMDGYTGKCPVIEQGRNDELLWLWEESEALYPSIYLELSQRDTHQAALYVYHRIQESMRVSLLPDENYAIPIYAYIRIVYKDGEEDYMSTMDLVRTIGETAALGAAGVICWGDMKITESEEYCLRAQRYIDKTMNPYILNVTTAASLCSAALCSNNGRCARKEPGRMEYLHLDPSRYRIKRSNTGELSVKGHLTQEDVDWYDERFKCLCYTDSPCYSPGIPNQVSNLYLGTLPILFSLACLFALS